jgi:hypothetical protein
MGIISLVSRKDDSPMISYSITTAREAALVVGGVVAGYVAIEGGAVHRWPSYAKPADAADGVCVYALLRGEK